MQIGRMLHKLIRIPCICLSDNFIKLTLALAQNARRYNIFVTFGRMMIQCWFVLFSILLFFYFFREKRRDRTGRWRKKSLSLALSIYLSRSRRVHHEQKHDYIFKRICATCTPKVLSWLYLLYSFYCFKIRRTNVIEPIQSDPIPSIFFFFLYVWIWWWSLALILECKNQIGKKQLFCFHFSLGKLLYQVHYLKSVRQTTQNSTMDPFKCIYSCMNS